MKRALSLLLHAPAPQIHRFDSDLLDQLSPRTPTRARLLFDSRKSDRTLFCNCKVAVGLPAPVWRARPRQLTSKSCSSAPFAHRRMITGACGKNLIKGARDYCVPLSATVSALVKRGNYGVDRVAVRRVADSAKQPLCTVGARVDNSLESTCGREGAVESYKWRGSRHFVCPPVGHFVAHECRCAYQDHQLGGGGPVKVIKSHALPYSLSPRALSPRHSVIDIFTVHMVK